MRGSEEEEEDGSGDGVPARTTTEGTTNLLETLTASGHFGARGKFSTRCAAALSSTTAGHGDAAASRPAARVEKVARRSPR